MNTNETFLSKNNTNIEKLLSLKMQIANELGGTDINFKIKGDRTLTLEDNKTFDIPGKITSIYKELNDMEDKANRASFSLHNNKNKKLGKEEEIITKSISEFKLSLMIKNKLNDEVKRPLDPNTLASNQNLLLRMIKNPNNHISEKTKSSMDRLLNNGFVDKDPVQMYYIYLHIEQAQKNNLIGCLLKK